MVRATRRREYAQQRAHHHPRRQLLSAKQFFAASQLSSASISTAITSTLRPHFHDGSRQPADGTVTLTRPACRRCRYLLAGLRTGLLRAVPDPSSERGASLPRRSTVARRHTRSRRRPIVPDDSLRALFLGPHRAVAPSPTASHRFNYAALPRTEYTNRGSLGMVGAGFSVATDVPVWGYDQGRADDSAA